ncbi:hypothetical protein CC86DRAFT_34555 [Ophiobolus disseminans]|uniref:Uncharacterized protein n=1 Tax=Ophiobolus disseminans TaxID=1469910 RepID=A0A6A6ZYI6_9PLEO|nr:hypothetical protein CC86DRAFT_34555 [Ophiobolus disseminans]
MRSPDCYFKRNFRRRRLSHFDNFPRHIRGGYQSGERSASKEVKGLEAMADGTLHVLSRPLIQPKLHCPRVSRPLWLQPRSCGSTAAGRWCMKPSWKFGNCVLELLGRDKHSWKHHAYHNLLANDMSEWKSKGYCVHSPVFSYREHEHHRHTMTFIVPDPDLQKIIMQLTIRLMNTVARKFVES